MSIRHIVGIPTERRVEPALLGDINLLIECLNGVVDLVNAQNARIAALQRVVEARDAEFELVTTSLNNLVGLLAHQGIIKTRPQGLITP